MSTAWLVPDGTDTAPGAQDGDYLLRRRGELYEVGSVSGSCTWVGTLSASLLPSLPQVDEPTEAPEQEAVLRAARGLQAAEDNRGG